MYSEQKQALAETQALKRPAVLAVSGVHNSGKTTLLEKLLPVLRSRGLKVGVIKHDGHDFTPDVPGTDSYRLAEDRGGTQRHLGCARLLPAAGGGGGYPRRRF